MDKKLLNNTLFVNEKNIRRGKYSFGGNGWKQLALTRKN